MGSDPVDVLFTGYAPVHFLCFRPIYERLVAHPRCRVFLSGGIRSGASETRSYDTDALYGPLGVDPAHVLSVDLARTQHYHLLFGANTKMIEPGLVDTRIQIFHGISFRNRAIRAENLGADFYFIVGPYMRRKFTEGGLLPAGDPRAVEVGFPKTDGLVNRGSDRADVCARHGFDGDRPILLYAPTGLKHNSLELFGPEVIDRLVVSERFDLMVKLHDHPKAPSRDWATDLAQLEGPRFRLVRDLDVIPLMAAADLLLTDASSVSSEFSLLDRPMVFLDTPRLIKAVSRLEGSMVDLDTWGRTGGMLVERPEDIVATVEASLARPTQDSAVRQAMKRDLFYNPGRATDAAMAFIEDYILKVVPRSTVEITASRGIPR